MSLLTRFFSIALFFAFQGYVITDAVAAKTRVPNHRIERPKIESKPKEAVREVRKSPFSEMKGKSFKAWEAPRKPENSKWYQGAERKLNARWNALEKLPLSPVFNNKARSKKNDLSLGFYAARDGFPRNDGFRSGTVKQSTLKAGDLIARKGDPFGRFVTRDHDPHSGSLSITPKQDRQKPTYYRILKDIPVLEGKAAGAWSQNGGGNQIKLKYSAQELIDMGYIKKTRKPRM